MGVYRFTDVPFKRLICFFVKPCIAIGVLFFVYHNVSIQDIGLKMQGLHSFLILFFALLFTNTLLSALKWQMLLGADGIKAGFGRLFSSYMIGTFISLFMPSNIGGDTYRIASVGKRTMTKSMASVMADRLSGFIALASICVFFACIKFSTAGKDVYVILPGILLTVLLGIVCSLFWPSLMQRALSTLGLSRFRKLESAFNALVLSFSMYKRKPVILTATMVLSYLFQLNVIVSVYILSKSLGLQVPFIAFCFFVPIISILEAIPVSIYGIGLRDTGYLLFFTQAGMENPEAHALAMAMLYVSASIVYASTGGLFLVKRLIFKA